MVILLGGIRSSRKTIHCTSNRSRCNIVKNGRNSDNYWNKADLQCKETMVRLSTCTMLAQFDPEWCARVCVPYVRVCMTSHQYHVQTFDESRPNFERVQASNVTVYFPSHYPHPQPVGVWLCGWNQLRTHRSEQKMLGDRGPEITTFDISTIIQPHTHAV